jgi:DNA-binding CsgD family transcriptional regulator
MPDLIDSIYECALAPECWPGVLDRIAGIAGARGGVLFTATRSASIPYWVGSPGIADDLDAYVSEGWLLRDPRRERLLAMEEARFVTERELFTAAELARDPTADGFYRARGLGAVAITGVPLTPDEWFICTFEREIACGPIDGPALERLNGLRPHLARSALIAGRLHLRTLQVAARILELLDIPALVFDETGKVLAANALIEARTEAVRWLAGGKVSLCDRRADAALRLATATISQAEDTQAGSGLRSFPVRDPRGLPSMVAHVVPIRGAARDVFARCAGVLILMPLGAAQGPPVDLIRSLFDLTATEARVARRLAGGASIDTMVVADGVSRNTIRTHVRAVLEKTGCTRQAEVVALLAGIAAPRGAR